MSALLRLSSAMFAVFSVGVALAGDVTTESGVDPLAKYRNNDSNHGLYEIRAEAKDFLDRQNVRDRTDWRAIDPDIRIVVERCAVPLRSKWTMFESRKSVLVSCDRTVTGSAQRKWEFPVSIGSDRLQRNYDIHEAALKFARSEQSAGHRYREVGFPSASTMVYKCAVPLRAEWHHKDIGRSVDIICAKTIDDAPVPRSWRIQIPVLD